MRVRLDLPFLCPVVSCLPIMSLKVSIRFGLEKDLSPRSGGNSMDLCIQATVTLPLRELDAKRLIFSSDASGSEAPRGQPCKGLDRSYR